MTAMTTANQLRGREIGSLFFAVFGALWIGLALYIKEILTAASLSLVVLDLTVLLGMAFWLLREAKRFPTVAEDPEKSRKFNCINIAQWIAVAIVAFSFVRLHIDAYVMCGITAVVGLHFFPLARLFRYALHYVTGSVLVTWAATSAILVPAEHLQGTSALGTGIILWVSAFTTLCLAFTLARRWTAVVASAQGTGLSSLGTAFQVIQAPKPPLTFARAVLHRKGSRLYSGRP